MIRTASAEGSKSTIYVETTIVSYLTARPSRDGLLLGQQRMTRQWWDQQREDYRLFISPVVVQEAARGDALAAQKRLALIEEIELLEPDAHVETLARQLQKALNIPDKASADAVHLAYAVYYNLDYLVTWNCAHLAGAHSLRRLADFTRTEGLWLPIICTPRELADLETKE